MAHDSDFVVFRQIGLRFFPGFFQGRRRDEAAVTDDVEVFRPRDFMERKMQCDLKATKAGMEKSARKSLSKASMSLRKNQSVKMAGSLISGQSRVRIIVPPGLVAKTAFMGAFML